MKKNVFVLVLLALAFVSCRPSQDKGDSACDTKSNDCEQQAMELNVFETIKLLPPDTACGAPLMKAVLNRRSDRDMGSENLSLRHLSDLLWMANGVNRSGGRRTVPSALALYPLETYAVLANGIYRYDPVAHELQPVLEGDHRPLAGLQDFVYQAPLNLVFVADYGKYQGDRKVPQEKWLYLASLDAGHCTQNVYLYCSAKGLKSVVRAGAKERELLRALGLDDGNHQFIVAQTVGY